jgi:hypothetical protein
MFELATEGDMYTDSDKSRLLAALPTSESKAVEATVLGESLGIVPVVAMGAMTSLYLCGEVEKIFVPGADSLYWRTLE